MSAAAGHHAHAHPDELVPLDVHRRNALARIRPLEAIELSLTEAHNCVLAQDVVADQHLPPFANSAMDGYALRAADAAAGQRLRVIGEIAAGAGRFPEVTPATAVRIMTGAPLPPGADTVVPHELTEEEGDLVRVPADLVAGANVREAGEDIRAGETVLRSGTLLGAADVGMLAALGFGQISVRPQPRVVVMSTGDELVEPGTALRPGQIRDSNSYMLVALAREAGARASRHPIVPDDAHALSEAFEGAPAHADLLITTGGVSAGRYDLVKQVLARLGDVEAVKVAMRPGMPQAFGLLTHDPARPLPCFGLPGNPVSAFVSFEVFVRPAIRRLQGRSDAHRPRVHAVLDEPMRSAEHKTEFVRVRLRRVGVDWHARATGAQGSGILRSVMNADGLAEVPADRTSLAAGERVVVHLLAET